MMGEISLHLDVTDICHLSSTCKLLQGHIEALGRTLFNALAIPDAPPSMSFKAFCQEWRIFTKDHILLLFMRTLGYKRFVELPQVEHRAGMLDINLKDITAPMMRGRNEHGRHFVALRWEDRTPVPVRHSTLPPHHAMTIVFQVSKEHPSHVTKPYFYSLLYDCDYPQADALNKERLIRLIKGGMRGQTLI